MKTEIEKTYKILLTASELQRLGNILDMLKEDDLSDRDIKLASEIKHFSCQ